MSDVSISTVAGRPPLGRRSGKRTAHPKMLSGPEMQALWDECKRLKAAMTRLEEIEEELEPKVEALYPPLPEAAYLKVVKRQPDGSAWDKDGNVEYAAKPPDGLWQLLELLHQEERLPFPSAIRVERLQGKIAEYKKWQVECRAIDREHGLTAAQKATGKAGGAWYEARRRFRSARTTDLRGLLLKLQDAAAAEDLSSKLKEEPYWELGRAVAIAIRDLRAATTKATRKNVQH